MDASFPGFSSKSLWGIAFAAIRSKFELAGTPAWTILPSRFVQVFGKMSTNPIDFSLSTRLTESSSDKQVASSGASIISPTVSPFWMARGTSIDDCSLYSKLLVIVLLQVIVEIERQLSEDSTIKPSISLSTPLTQPSFLEGFVLWSATLMMDSVFFSSVSSEIAEPDLTYHPQHSLTA